MEPDYTKAATKAGETFVLFWNAEPLHILQGMPNVRVFSFDINPVPGEETWDSCTLVREKEGSLQYIVMYNRKLPAFMIKRTLARELGHIILGHDGTGPEDVWMEEASCFAYHLLCPKPAINVIYYRPYRKTFTASYKDMQIFSSIEEMKQAVADEYTRFKHFVGKSIVYSPDDVEIIDDCTDYYAGWKNCRSVVLDGKAVGYCGE